MTRKVKILTGSASSLIETEETAPRLDGQRTRYEKFADISSR